MAKYTKEEKQKAIDLYIKYCKRTTRVIKELGYPNERHTLVSWYREYEENGRVKDDGRKEKKLSQVYSEEQVHAAVSFYVEHGKSLSRTVEVLGYPCRAKTLKGWIEKLSPEELVRRDYGDTQKRYRTEDVTKALCSSQVRGEASVEEIAKEYGVSRGSVYHMETKLRNNGYYSSMEKECKDLPHDKKGLTEEVERLLKQIEDLNRDVHRLRMEKDILEMAAKIIKKDEGISLESLTNREKATVIDALRKKYKVADLISATGIARSTYFAQIKSIRKGDRYREIRVKLRDLFDLNYGCYGYRRLNKLLREAGDVVSEKVVRRLMKEENIHVPSYRSSKKYSSYIGEVTPPVENLIKRDFHADAPNEKWLTDITEFHIPAGKVYLSPIIDCFDGVPVSWTLGTSPNSDLANKMLDKAIKTLKPWEKPIVHSDRGGHYRWEGWISRMDSRGLTRSMSKKGCSPDNSACEGFFGRIKNEVFYGRDWKGWTLDDFMYFIDRYLYWFRNERIKTSLNNKSPNTGICFQSLASVMNSFIMHHVPITFD